MDKSRISDSKERMRVLSRNLANNGTYTLTSGKKGFGIVTIGNSQEYAFFSFTDAAAVTLISNSTNVTTTGGSANKLNIYDGGTSVIIENKLGSTLLMTLFVIYNSE